MRLLLRMYSRPRMLTNQRRERKAARRQVRLNARRPGSSAHKRDAKRGRHAVHTAEQVEQYLVRAIEREAARLTAQRKRIERGAEIMQRMVATPDERA